MSCVACEAYAKDVRTLPPPWSFDSLLNQDLAGYYSSSFVTVARETLQRNTTDLQNRIRRLLPQETFLFGQLRAVLKAVR